MGRREEGRTGEGGIGRGLLEARGQLPMVQMGPLKPENTRRRQEGNGKTGPKAGNTETGMGGGQGKRAR